MSRISLDLPDALIARVERQVAYMASTSRQQFMETAILGLVRDFEKIDQENGVSCPRCHETTEVDDLTDGRFRVCTHCTWRWPEPLEAR